MNFAKPQTAILTPEQIGMVHEKSLEILSTIGLRVDSSRARSLFQNAGSAISQEGNILIKPELVEWTLNSSPGTVDIYDRSRSQMFQLGKDGESKTRFGVGVTNLHWQEPETEMVVPFNREHMGFAARLGQALDSYDCVSTAGVLQDVSPMEGDFYAALEISANTVKPQILLVSEDDAFEYVLDLLEYLHGDLSESPFVLPYVNLISPLVLNSGTSDKMFSAINRGMPFIFSNCALLGASSPITPAGGLAMMNAELLAGLVFSQLVKEGTPVVLGSLPGYFNMKTMTVSNSTQSFLISLAGAEMIAHYGLPHCGTSGNGNGRGADLRSSCALWMNHLTSCMGKVGLAPFVGGVFQSVVFSPSTVVLADHIIRLCRSYSKGFSIDEDSFAIEEIRKVGPGGDFLGTNFTFKLFRYFQDQNDIWPNLTVENWINEGHPRVDEQLRKYTGDLLQRAAPPEDHDRLLELGEQYITKELPKIR